MAVDFFSLNVACFSVLSVTMSGLVALLSNLKNYHLNSLNGKLNGVKEE